MNTAIVAETTLGTNASSSACAGGQPRCPAAMWIASASGPVGVAAYAATAARAGVTGTRVNVEGQMQTIEIEPPGLVTCCSASEMHSAPNTWNTIPTAMIQPVDRDRLRVIPNITSEPTNATPSVV